MKSKKILMMAFGLMIFAPGCFSVRMDGERRCDSGALQNQLTVEAVDKVIPDIQLGTGYYSLKLIARGRFTQHSGKCVYWGKPSVAIGIFPGVPATEDTLKGERYFMIPFCSAIYNFAFAGIPTLSSLLVEPFRDYYCSRSSDLNFADFGLLGCRKYIADARRDGFAEESQRVLPEVGLFAYKVEIDGVLYADIDGGDGYVGEVFFTTNKSHGDLVRIRIVEAPSTRNDSADRLSDLVGVEMTAVLP